MDGPERQPAGSVAGSGPSINRRIGPIVYQCEVCAGYMKVKSNQSYPGFMIRAFTCPDCGRVVERVVEPRQFRTI